MKNLKEASLIILLAMFYFASAYFAAAALIPTFAFQTALVALIGGMVIYRFLMITGNDKPGLPLALLILSPFICITAGVLWWLMRLMGFWEIR